METNNNESSNRYYPIRNANLLSSTPQYISTSETPNQMYNNFNNPSNHIPNIQSSQQLLSPNDYIQGPNSSYIEQLYNPANVLNPSTFAQAHSPAYNQNQNQLINYVNITSASSPNIPNSNYENKINQRQIPMTPRAKFPHNTNNNNSFNNEISITNSNNTNYNNLNDSKPMLQNIVSTADLKCKLDLRNIALKAKNAEYNPKRFAAVIMRIREPKTTALIFASGKMVCTGAKSEEESRKAARQYAKIIQKLNYNVKFSSFKIQNIVGSCDVGFKISLEGLSTQHKHCSYEPEVFPGLIFKMVEPKIVLLIFVSGKIVLTGAKERNEIYDAYKKILPLLQRHKKKELPDRNNSETHTST